jgi:hypothetical protein
MRQAGLCIVALGVNVRFCLDGNSSHAGHHPSVVASGCGSPPIIASRMPV